MLKLALFATSLLSSICLAGEPFPREAELLQDVKVADGFEATLFAAPPLVNYPVFVAAAPDGTLFVSSDGNGSLGRNPDRGRILRLRDTDGDGRADEVKEFVKNVDSPRGLVWDKDRLYLMHPPDLSVYIDKDGDGISDEKKVLVKGLAFGFKDRPPDHTTNGMSIGIDGWLYIAVGDFGFMKAEGSDGRKLQLRGGGVVRVRPDGTDLQLYARGTRNILEVAVSPTLDLFTRDNTNDGDGWDLKLHHIAGFDDFGYPRLFKNFPEETRKSIGEYGGGSGCGACWIDEPGWTAEWNNKPYTSDWGLGPVFCHTVEPDGAGFKETEKPKPLVSMTRSTDIDVDAQGYAYVASWKGATFDWNGPEAGYIVRVSPKGMQPAKVPDFDKATNDELVKLLESPSHRVRLEAQRTFIRRPKITKPYYQKKDVDNQIESLLTKIKSLMTDETKSLKSRIAGIFTISQISSHDFFLSMPLEADSTLPWRIKGLSNMAFPIVSIVLSDAKKPIGETSRTPLSRIINSSRSGVGPLRDFVFLDNLNHSDARIRKEALAASAFFHGSNGVWADNRTPSLDLDYEGFSKLTGEILPLLTDPDPVVAHVALQVMRQFKTSDACFAVMDDPKADKAAFAAANRVLFGIHEPKVIDGMIERLPIEKDLEKRRQLLIALCRLHFQEGPWIGDSWGTRPDSRGPYYQPEEWAESKKIFAVLQDELKNASGDEAAFLIREFNRHRISLNVASNTLVALAQKDKSLYPVLVTQLSQMDTVPEEAVPLLIDAANLPDSLPLTRMNAALALCKTDNKEAVPVILGVLSVISDKHMDVKNAFTASRLIENEHHFLEAQAEKVEGNPSMWADAMLLNLAARKVGSPEPREMAAKSIEAGWSNPKRRQQLMRAIRDGQEKGRSDLVLKGLKDSDEVVRKSAAETVSRLKLDVDKLKASLAPSGPLIGTMKPEEVIEAVMNTKGDVALGEQLFAQQGCGACHTVKQEDAPKGPFLGNIAATYKRRELAEAVLLPNKTMAQGFVTNVFTLKDGAMQMGFVTQEAADKIVIRDIAAQEITLDPKNITKREKSDKSLMPEGLVAGISVKDFASLLDYLEALAVKK